LKAIKPKGINTISKIDYDHSMPDYLTSDCKDNMSTYCFCRTIGGKQKHSKLSILEKRHVLNFD
jgi:hypothetical protein